jgi:hypothetical protein
MYTFIYTEDSDQYIKLTLKINDMRKYIFAVAIVGLGFTNSIFAQVEWDRSYSKEVAMYRAKEFLMLIVLDTNDISGEFELTPLVAESSGGLATKNI